MGDTIKTKFNLDFDSTNKTSSIAENVGRTLVKKKVLMLVLEEIHTTSHSDFYKLYSQQNV